MDPAAILCPDAVPMRRFMLVFAASTYEFCTSAQALRSRPKPPSFAARAIPLTDGNTNENPSPASVGDPSIDPFASNPGGTPSCCVLMARRSAFGLIL